MAACGGSEARGTLGAACHPDNTCDPGLVCAIGECVVGNTDPRCGDGIVSPAIGEECDHGADNGDDRDCRADCQLNVCGDGQPNSVGPARIEACDDGNDVNSDGCSTTCTAPACGNGITEQGEQCDDGNRDDLDGCQASCTFSVETKVCLNGTTGRGTTAALTPLATLGAATIELWYRSADPETPATADAQLVYVHPTAAVGGAYPSLGIELANAADLAMPTLSGRVLAVEIDARGGPQNQQHARGFDIDASIPGFDEKGWHHYAVVFTGTTTRAFIDGVELTTTAQPLGSEAATFASAFGPSFSTTYGDLFLSIGYFARDDVRYARGGFRDVRVSKVARYTATFVPPFHHVADANTLVLLPLNEATGAMSSDHGGSAYHVTWSGGFSRSNVLLACP